MLIISQTVMRSSMHAWPIASGGLNLLGKIVDTNLTFAQFKTKECCVVVLCPYIVWEIGLYWELIYVVDLRVYFASSLLRVYVSCKSYFESLLLHEWMLNLIVTWGLLWKVTLSECTVWCLIWLGAWFMFGYLRVTWEFNWEVYIWHHLWTHRWWTNMNNIMVNIYM